jgi:hydantoinase/carbamoylase family amidase
LKIDSDHVNRNGKGDPVNRFDPNLERVKRDILNLSRFISPVESGYTRISFSEEDRKAREHIGLLMKQEAGLKVRIDAAGNLIGRRKGKKEKPSILIGSHLDTVRGGGRFDGMSGVIAGLEVARLFMEKGFDPIHPLEVVSFLAEEPSPFGLSTIGSRAMAGKLKEEQLTSLKDATGRDLAAAIHEMGGSPEKLGEAKRPPGSILAYLELHIEQGPTLVTRRIPIGIVKGIVGISRAKITIGGRNDHAGTIPMALRRDALTAGSEVVLALERICRGKEGLVGTVGKVEVSPNSINVIPGKVVLIMDVRSLNEDRIDQTFSLLRNDLEKIREQRGVEIRVEPEVVSQPVLFEKRITDQLCEVCHRLGLPYLEIISGAGHDAMHIANIAPAAMIFIPSQEGRSHCPEEWTEFEQIGQGIEVLASTIAEIDHGQWQEEKR